MGNVTGVDGFKIDSAGRLARQEPDLILEEWRSGGGPFWIHVGDEDHEARAEMLTKMGLDDASVEGLLDPGHAPRVQSLAEGLFLEIPVALAGTPWGQPIGQTARPSPV
jgi:Mg2+ and Co2+ transporter CorA